MKGLSASVMTGSRSNNNLSKSVDFDIGKFNLLKDEKNSDQFLPRAFDVKAMEDKRLKDTKECMICDITFTNFIGKHPIRHCKRCARSVCPHCSENKRILSKTDKE